VKTIVLGSEERAHAHRLIKEELSRGQQAFIVFPLIEESDVAEDKALMGEMERLRTEAFSSFSVAILHGQMSSEDKRAALAAFSEGRAQLLLSTTVIEVGIDVPEATVIMIESAHRFGLAQLHQLRGRVGRSTHPSLCILLNRSSSKGSRERLEALREVHDGLRLAEIDLEQRGEGDLLGSRQSGLFGSQLVSFPRDLELLEVARAEAAAILKDDPQLTDSDHLRLADWIGASLADRTDRYGAPAG